MGKLGLLITFIILAGYSCRQKNETAQDNSSINDTTKFFQVAQFVKNEIDEVNKTPYFIYKIDINNNKRDSTPITTANFNELANQFLKPDINDPAIKKNYNENIFHDQTTKSFTISYTTKNKELEVQNVEVLLEEDGQTVKRIFIRKFLNNSDSSAIVQLSWKPGESFLINRLVQLPDNKETSTQTTIVWNAKG